ncbi:MAG: CDP-glycerol glycerophosphotransferase family protein, partial [Patescibacteria group bacterium]
FEKIGLPAEASAKAGPHPLIHFSTTELYPFEYIIKTVSKAGQSGAISRQPHFYASVHPGGNMKNHEGLKKYGAIVRYSFGRHPESPIRDFLYNPSEEELYTLVALFKHSNLLINHSSTTAVESMLADVPIINVKYGRPWDFWRWPKSPVCQDFQEHYDDLVNEGATAVVTSERELVQATQRYLEHPELDRDARQKTLKKMITTVDGTASEKVFQCIKEHAQ